MWRTLHLGGLASLGVACNFFSYAFLLVHFGATASLDALVTSQLLPTIWFSIIIVPLGHVLVPLLANEKEQGFSAISWGLFMLTAALISTLCVIGALTIDYWIFLILPGVAPETRQLAIQLTEIHLISLPLISATAITASACRSRQRFVRAELSLASSSALYVVLAVYLAPRYGIHAVAWAFVARYAFSLLLTINMLGKFTWPDWSNVIFRIAWQRTRPLLFGSSIYKTGQAVDTFLSSMGAAGDISLINFGQRMIGAGLFIADRAITVPMVTQMAKLLKNKDPEGFRRLYKKRLMQVLFLATMVSALLLIGGQFLLDLFIGYGGVTGENVTLLWKILLGFIGLIYGGLVGQVLTSAFYSKGETKTPTRVGIVGYLVGIVLKVSFFFLFGVIGLALGTSLYYIGNALAMGYLLERKPHESNLPEK